MRQPRNSVREAPSSAGTEKGRDGRKNRKWVLPRIYPWLESFLLNFILEKMVKIGIFVANLVYFKWDIKTKTMHSFELQCSISTCLHYIMFK